MQNRVFREIAGKDQYACKVIHPPINIVKRVMRDFPASTPWVTDDKRFPNTVSASSKNNKAWVFLGFFKYST